MNIIQKLAAIIRDVINIDTHIPDFIIASPKSEI